MYMKQLSEWLSTKVVKPLRSYFPKNLNKQGILKFLDSRGFVESIYSKKIGTHNISLSDFIDELKTSDNPLFCLGQERKDDIFTFWIRFANAGVVSDDNPIYFCRYNLKDFDNPTIDEMVILEHARINCPYSSFEEFAEDMNNKF